MFKVINRQSKIKRRIYLYKLLKKEDGQKKLLLKVEDATLIILAFPLYVDCLPAGVIKAL